MVELDELYQENSESWIAWEPGVTVVRGRSSDDYVPVGMS